MPSLAIDRHQAAAGDPIGPQRQGFSASERTLAWRTGPDPARHHLFRKGLGHRPFGASPSSRRADRLLGTAPLIDHLGNSRRRGRAAGGDCCGGAVGAGRQPRHQWLVLPASAACPRPGQRGFRHGWSTDHLAGYWLCRGRIRRCRNPFPQCGSRINIVAEHVRELGACCRIPPHPAPVQTPPPIMIAGQGDKMLDLQRSRPTSWRSHPWARSRPRLAGCLRQGQSRRSIRRYRAAVRLLPGLHGRSIRPGVDAHGRARPFRGGSASSRRCWMCLLRRPPNASNVCMKSSASVISASTRRPARPGTPWRSCRRHRPKMTAPPVPIRERNGCRQRNHCGGIEPSDSFCPSNRFQPSVSLPPTVGTALE